MFKVFYVMGKALSGELSCPCDGFVIAEIHETDYIVVICWTSPFVFFGTSGLFCRFYSIFDGKSCQQTV